MAVIGYITLAQLSEIRRSGISPEQAVDMLMVKAKARHPNAGAVVIQQKYPRTPERGTGVLVPSAT